MRESKAVRVYHEKKRDGVRGGHEKKSDRVTVTMRNSNGVSSP